MLKKVAGKKLGRSKTALLALMRSQAKSFVANGYITTTESKAKVVQRFIEKLSTKAKADGVAKRRELLAKLGNDNTTANKLIAHISKIDRKSGFTRIIKFPARLGDNAKVARIEWVDKIVVEQPKVKVKESKEKGKEKSKK
jgi:large subunit ribosomal protein L17